MQARNNFFGLFPRKSKKAKLPEVTTPKYDFEETTARALRMAEPFAGKARAFLIQAADRRGKVVWYYLPDAYLSQRGFEDASASGLPKTLIRSKTPWVDVRNNLRAYRRPERIPFVVIDAIGERVEGPLTLEDIANRNPRSRADRIEARMEKSVLAAPMAKLLGTLHQAKSLAWVAHWNAQGPNFYGTHLMFQRIYEGMDESIDELGERYVAYTRSPVPYAAFRGPELPDGLESRLQDSNSAVPLVDAVLGEAQRQSDAVREMLSDYELGRTTSGLDDYLMALNNTLDTFRYLLFRYTSR